jgi:hypothetical protein
MRRALACGGALLALLALLAPALLACWHRASLTRRTSFFLPLFSRRDIFAAPAAFLGPHLVSGPIARPQDGAFEVWEEAYDQTGANRRVEFAKIGDNGEVLVSVTANPSRLGSVNPAWARDNSWHAVARQRGQRLRGTSFRMADGFSFLDVMLEGKNLQESLTLMAHAGTLWTLSCAAEASHWEKHCPQVVDSFRPGFDQWARW